MRSSHRADILAAAGAPKAPAIYLRHSRRLNSIKSLLHQLQEDALAVADAHDRTDAELRMQLDRARSKEGRGLIEEQRAANIKSRKSRLAEIKAEQAEANHQFETDGRCAVRLDEWIDDEIVGQKKRIRDLSLPPTKLLPPGIAATIEAKRAELAVNAERRADIESRPGKPSDLKVAMTRTVAARAEMGRPPFDARIRGGRDPAKLELMLLHGGQPGMMVGDGGTNFFVWLLHDQIEARLHALVDEADLTDAMSDVEQAAALAALDAERLAIEREEEALIRMAEAQGMTIARRADADPRSVLMIEVL